MNCGRSQGPADRHRRARAGRAGGAGWSANVRAILDRDMGKGELTRQAILERAVCLATRIGLDALSIGRLADDLGMSKSGLFAHFRAKETLQVQVLQHGAAAFVEHVVRPALNAPRGEPRVRALFDRWLLWARERPGRGGCLFVGAATELDDKPGPARDELVKQQRDWLDFIAGAVRIAISEGDFKPQVDPLQIAHELHGIMLGYYHAARLLKDPAAETRARRALETVLASARATAPTRRTAAVRTSAKRRQPRAFSRTT